MSQWKTASCRVCMRRVTWGCLPSPPNEPSPTSSPMRTPRSKSETACFTIKKNVKQPRPAGTRSSVHERGDDQVPRRLLALAVCLDVVARLEVLVDHLALQRAHRLERHRPSVVYRRLGRLVGRSSQRRGASLPIAAGVDDQSLAIVASTEGDPIRQVLDGVDGLAVRTDDRPQVLAREFRRNPVGVLTDPHLGIDVELVRDPVEQLLNASRRRTQSGFHRYLLLPERFFFFRGGGGGASRVRGRVAVCVDAAASPGSGFGRAPRRSPPSPPL